MIFSLVRKKKIKALLIAAFAVSFLNSSAALAAPAQIIIEGKQVIVDSDAVSLKAGRNMPLETLMKSIDKNEALLRIVKVTDNIYLISVLDGLPRERQVLYPKASDMLETQEATPQ